MKTFPEHPISPSRPTMKLTIMTLAVASTLGLGSAEADHGAFTVSAATYRIPYADGTTVTANNDHHTHPSVPNRVDLGGGDGNTIVAAASGIIRAIVDYNGDDFDRGDELAADGVTAQDDALEHSCHDDKDEDGNSIRDSVVKGLCQEHNNYVWIEHPNGEWTKYTHFKTGSVSIDNNWSVGDTILVGQPLGSQGDVGSAGGSHLHFEVAAIPESEADCPADSPENCPFSELGGFVNSSWNVVTQVCFSDGDDNNDGLYTEGEEYTAGPCPNTAPTAEADGPHQVNEGSSVLLDGTGSSDPENAILSYLWSPATHLDDPSSATPLYTGIDDLVEIMTLTVSDEGGDVSFETALTDDDTTTVTVLNVAPTVQAVVDNNSINEGQAVKVSATFSDPGILDTHTATIDWDDGNGPQVVDDLAALAAGIYHVYGDNGNYVVTVTVTDDDEGSGSDTVQISVTNLNPTASIDVSGAISFPGGDYLVVESGTALPASADGADLGSDDLTFRWSVGDENIHYNNGVSADLAKSPGPIFPFEASDSINALYAAPGVETLSLVLTDDDGGSANADANVIVTGTADATEGLGWWKHQYSGSGTAQIDATTAAAYLDIVNAVSSVFSETVLVATSADLHAVLSPTGNDRRPFASAELMQAWLQFASGAVAWNASVDGEAFLDLMTSAEAVINNAAATDAELHSIELRLAKLRHAE